jgi:hypothetical protein
MLREAPLAPIVGELSLRLFWAKNSLGQEASGRLSQSRCKQAKNANGAQQTLF